MTPELDAQMRALPIATKAEAQEFLRQFRDYCWQNNPYGMVLPVRHKPASVRCPDIFRKARQAEEMAEACYWQMPYEEARVRFWGLPLSRWRDERSKRGLA